MGLIGGALGIRLLNMASHNGTVGYPEATAYFGKSKIEVLLGPRIWDEIRGKDVLDFGSGEGTEAVEMAQRGARRIIGLEIRSTWLELATAHAAAQGVADRCAFAREWHEPVDVILCLDSFEHFDDPAGALRTMHALLKPAGCVFASFGPTWYHPLGGHTYSVFPYSHLIFTESALVRWRAIYKPGNARTIEETGLNKMTVRRFRNLVERSPLKLAAFETVPIRRLRRFANAMTREFTTSIVRCKLVPR
jgi:SAM-dependent methyltransferase